MTLLSARRYADISVDREILKKTQNIFIFKESSWNTTYFRVCWAKYLYRLQILYNKNKFSIYFNKNGKAQIIETNYLLSATSRTNYLNTLDLNHIDAYFEWSKKDSHQPIHKTISEISNFYYSWHLYNTK